MTTVTPLPKPLNVRQTADRLGVHVNTVRNWVASGHLTPAVLTTQPLRFDPAEVDALAAHNRAGKVPSPATTLARVQAVLAAWDDQTTGWPAVDPHGFDHYTRQAWRRCADDLRAALQPTPLQTQTKAGTK